MAPSRNLQSVGNFGMLSGIADVGTGRRKEVKVFRRSDVGKPTLCKKRKGVGCPTCTYFRRLPLDPVTLRTTPATGSVPKCPEAGDAKVKLMLEYLRSVPPVTCTVKTDGESVVEMLPLPMIVAEPVI